MAKLSLSLTVNGKTTAYDCHDEACLGECLSDFYTTVAGLARNPGVHKAAAANCPSGKGKLLTVSGHAAADGVPYAPIQIVVGGLDDATHAAAEKALGDCCARAKSQSGSP